MSLSAKDNEMGMGTWTKTGMRRKKIWKETSIRTRVKFRIRTIKIENSNKSNNEDYLEKRIWIKRKQVCER